MKTIQKYNFGINYAYLAKFNAFELEMPAYNDIVHVGIENETPCLWAFVDTDNETVTYTFKVYETGQEIAEDDEYIATFQDGDFAWHLFYG